MGSNDSMGYTVYVCVVVSSFRGNIFKNKHRNLILWLIFIGVILGASLVFLCRVTGFFFFLFHFTDLVMNKSYYTRNL